MDNYVLLCIRYNVEQNEVNDIVVFGPKSHAYWTAQLENALCQEEHMIRKLQEVIGDK